MKNRTFTLVMFTGILIAIILMELCRTFEYGGLVAILICVVFLVLMFIFTKKVEFEVNE